MLTVDDYAKVRVGRSRWHVDSRDRAHLPTFPAQGSRDSRQPAAEALHPCQPQTGPSAGLVPRCHRRGAGRRRERAAKQRHTAMQLFRRLRDEYGYSGGYDQVRRYVGKHRRERRETFIPLAHDPGQRLECDFGHIHVDFPDGRRLVPVLVAAWAYSNTLSPRPCRPSGPRPFWPAWWRPRVLRSRAARGLVGQPHHRGQPNLQGPRARAERVLRRPGQPLRL